MKSKILVTAALPYANGPLHMGHLLEYIQADIFARFLRLKQKDVLFVCADDTHGTPILVNAEKQGIKPEELIAKFYKQHVDVFNKALVSFDNYYTTNSPENKKYSDLFFNAAKDKGYIYKKPVKQLYCEHCKRFLPDRYIKGKCPKCGAEGQYGDVCEVCGATYSPEELINPKCVVCNNEPVLKETEHYFFKLSHFSEKLKEWIVSNKNLQQEIKNFVLSWISQGLKDWCISRDEPYFGFKIPGEERKYYYVWLDAPIGYISATENYCETNRGKGKECKTEDYWKNENSSIIHFIGKDIIYFHFLFWPAMLMAAGFSMPENIFVHGFLNINNEKMSKSRGTFITADEFLSSHDIEHIRFYLAYMLSNKPVDVNFSYADFYDKINNELIANIANFCFRVMSFCNKNFGSEVRSTDDKINDKIQEIIREAGQGYNSYNFKNATKAILKLSSLGNKYFQDNKPWVLVKGNEIERKKAMAVVGASINIVKNIAILIKPIMPGFSKSIEDQLNMHGLLWYNLGEDIREHKINKAEIVFRKIENKASGNTDINANKNTDKGDNMSDKIQEIQNSLDNIAKSFDLRIAEITEVKEHPNAFKLYIMQINLGAEKRQIVAGLRQYFSEKDLLGKKIVVVANLKPAMLRGEESKGMLLAAEDSKGVHLLEPQGNPGDKVFFFEEYKPKDQISIEEFFKAEIVVDNKKAVLKGTGKVLRTNTADVFVDAEDNSKIK